MLRKRAFSVSAAAVLALGLLGCDDTKLIQSWSAPEADRANFQKVLALAMLGDQASRRNAEEEMVQALDGAYVVPSYKVLNALDIKDSARAKQKLAAAGFDGVVLIRAIGREQRVTYVPGAYPAYYRSFWGYYDHMWPYAYDPGYVYTQEVEQLEALVYSLKQDRMLWAGVVESTNPRDVDDIVQRVAKSLSEQMSGPGLVAGIKR